MRDEQQAAERAVTPVLSNLYMIAVVVVVGVIVVVGALSFLPENAEPRPRADFTIDRGDGQFRIVPRYMEDGTAFVLGINGRDVYTWQGGGSRDVRELSCLFPGDRITIRSVHDEEQRTYLIEEHDVGLATDCGVSGTGAQFAYAKVGDRQVPLRDPSFEFTLAIDPNGPDSIGGDAAYPTSNPWTYVQRYDRAVEDLAPPVYVVVFADNVGDWDATPTEDERKRIEDTVSVADDGSLVPDPGGSEPTNDVYLVFKPGCEQSEFLYVTKQAGYENHVLLDGETLFVATGGNEGETYTGPGVTCAG